MAAAAEDDDEDAYDAYDTYAVHAAPGPMTPAEEALAEAELLAAAEVRLRQ